MKLRVTTYMYVDFNLEDYGIDPNLTVDEICSKLSEILNEDGEAIFILLEDNDSNIVVSEIKPGEE